MRQGVPGFIPQRLVEAREARGLTQTALAQHIGKSGPTISRWEAGAQQPEPAALEEVGRVLGLPLSYFTRQPIEHGNAPLFFRSMVATTEAARQKARVRLRWAQEISLILQDCVDLPVSRLPNLVGDRDFRTFDDSEIEDIATQCRRYWGLGDGPISNLHLLLENQGIVVVHDEVGSAKMDGLSSWSEADGRGYIYVAIDKPSAVRGRFNLAHELGHLILHRHVVHEEISNQEDFKEIERQAHRFAGAFLLPARTFTPELSTVSLNSLLSMKDRWKVSIAAMIVRCKNLGIIDDYYSLRLWKHYSSRGWRTGEPLDDRISVEQPCLLGRSIRLLTENGGWSILDLITELPFSPSDIERLASLPEGYLRQAPAEIVAMPRLKTPTPTPAPAPAQDHPEGRKRGQVINFQKRWN